MRGLTDNEVSVLEDASMGIDASAVFPSDCDEWPDDAWVRAGERIEKRGLVVTLEVLDDAGDAVDVWCITDRGRLALRCHAAAKMVAA